ncbi:hypothetical protein [Ensifer sp.]|uniref:hypothetical protein n=1 Tax=Ensifer sp. TaxID=1872086 RepID=UPI0028996F69|nr:hypothetical protein [Ensifer sp.]
MKRILARFAAVSAVAAAMMASTTSLAHADVTARYGELQAVLDAINDPDPLMRLAQLEEILKKGDATEVQLAIRTAFQVSDPNVRSLALRAHFASFRTFIITAELPEAMQAVLDGKDQEAIKDLSGNRLYGFLKDQGFQFSLQSEYPSSEALEFQVASRNENPSADNQKSYSGTGNIRGGLINIVTNVKNGFDTRNCSFELTDYEAFTLVGRGTCNFENGFEFPVRLHLFDNETSAAGN